MTAKLVVGLSSLAATVLAGLQTFLRLAERAERHKQAGVRYGALRRELELEIVSAAVSHDFLAGFRDRWAALDEEAHRAAVDIRTLPPIRAVGTGTDYDASGAD